MADKVLIYIEDLSSDKAQWLHEGQCSSGSLAEIADTLKQQEIILVINGKNVYTSSVELANASLGQIQKAAPYALEDELAEDVDQLHFAYGEVVKNKPVAVAVITKNALQGLITKLKELNLQITACYVDYLLLSHTEKHWSILNNDTLALVKTSAHSGFSLPQYQLEELLKIQISALESPPEAIDVYELHSQMDKTTLAGVPVQTHLVKATDFLNFLNSQLTTEYKSINLLQGDFKTTKKFDRAKKTWWIAAACVGLWLLANGIGTMSNYFYYSHKEKQLTAQVNKIYKQVFPDSTTIVSPKIRIERELEKYQHASSDGGFISLVVKIGPIVKQATDVRVESFVFQNQQGTLTIRTKTFQDLQNFANQLAKTGLPIQQTNAKSEAKSVMASFNITMPRS